MAGVTLSYVILILLGPILITFLLSIGGFIYTHAPTRARSIIIFVFGAFAMLMFSSIFHEMGHAIVCFVFNVRMYRFVLTPYRSYIERGVSQNDLVNMLINISGGLFASIMASILYFLSPR